MDNILGTTKFKSETNSLPEGWKWCKLEDACDILDSDRIPVNSEERNERIKNKEKDELYPYYGATGQVGWIDDYIYDGEFVLLGEDGAPFLDPLKNKAYLIKGKIWVNNHAHILRAKGSNKYLCHYLNFIDYRNFVSGTTRLKLTQTSMKKIDVLLPPLSTQHRIVEKIEELFSDLDNGVENLKKAKQQLETYRQAVLKAAFEGKLTKQWRKQQQDLPTPEELKQQIEEERERQRKKELEAWRQEVKEWKEQGEPGRKPWKPRKRKSVEPITTEELNRLSNFPNTWSVKRLIELSNKIFDGPFGSNLKTEDYVDEGVRVIRLENIGWLEFKNEHKTYVTEEKYQDLTKHTVKHTDIIFASFISDSTRVTVLPETVQKAINKADCFCVRVFGFINPYYVAYYLATKEAYNQLIHKVHGATRPRVNTTQLKNTVIPFCSKKEQDQIVQEIELHFSIIDQLDETIKNELQKAEALHQSILRKAFEGKLVG